MATLFVSMFFASQYVVDSIDKNNICNSRDSIMETHGIFITVTNLVYVKYLMDWSRKESWHYLRKPKLIGLQ